MRVELTRVLDPVVIKKALLIDDIYKNVICDRDIATWEPNLHVSAYNFVFVDGEPFGIICLERFCSNSVIFHGGVFEIQRHKHTPEVLKAIMRILKDELENKVLMTTISVDNLPAIKMVKKAGLKEQCIIKNAAVIGDMMILAE